MADSIEVIAIKTKIATSAADGIATATSDGQTVTKMSVSDQILAANYLATQNAANKNSFGLRFIKMIPPGLP